MCPSCHRYRTPDGTPCRRCADTAPALVEPVGRCAGHDGAGCGAPLLEIGPLGPLCDRCEVHVRRARAAKDAQWDAAVQAAGAAVEAGSAR
ncbi:hypothetical protein [Streptomyces sp. NRRL F-5727]|uniref:hypothetical protein n=1 Tax=Streptomyces sp. NRRL F-5727 TaxID=1463871 RepID=UPI0004CB535D|nr:hypothetical protein [Streptomyces sp. NRRL F-5727]